MAPEPEPSLHPKPPPPDPPLPIPADVADGLQLAAPHRKASARRRAPLRTMSRLLFRFGRSMRNYAVTTARLRAARKSLALRLTPLSNALLGVVAMMLLTALSSFMAYHASPAYYPVNSDVPTLADAMHRSVSPFTAARLTSSLDSVENARFVADALTNSFHLPRSLLRKMPLEHQYTLLTRLQSAGEVAQSSPLKLFVLHVIGSGAADRLAAISSAITYAQNTGRFLLILWDIARGGENFGSEPLTPLVGADKQKFMFLTVDSLRLSPNSSDWSEFQINYYTEAGGGGYPLDSVTELSSRHIFYRNESKVEGKYASLYPGVFTMQAFLTPGSSIQQAWYNFVKDWTFPHLDNKEVADILHRVYSIPWVFSDALSDHMKRRLLRALDQSTAKRALFVHTQYGLGNRLRGLGSAMAIAKVTGRVLVLIWEPDVHLNCAYSDLFVNDVITIEKLNLAWPPRDTRKGDRALYTVDFYNFMRTEGVQVHNPLKHVVNPRSGRHAYVKTAYVIRSSFTPRIVSITSAYWNTMREQLVPTVEIMSLVHDPAFLNIRNMVGVHIRSRTIENDIKGVSEEFYGNGSRTTDHWRRLTGLKTFETKMARLNRRYKFFVAADARYAIDELERKFGTHRIFSIPRDMDCVTRDVECAKLALADILLLSQVPALLGSNWSSFTEGAARLSGHVKVLLAGVHFGRQPRENTHAS